MTFGFVSSLSCLRASDGECVFLGLLDLDCFNNRRLRAQLEHFCAHAIVRVPPSGIVKVWLLWGHEFSAPEIEGGPNNFALVDLSNPVTVLHIH